MNHTAPELLAAGQTKWLRHLDGYNEKQAVQTAIVMSQVEREILHQWDRMTDFSKARAITLLDETRAVTGAAKSIITTDMAAMLGRVSSESASTHSRILSFGGRAANVTEVALDPDQMASFWKRTPVGGHLLKDWVDRSFDQPTIDKIQREIAAGMWKGESYRELGNRLKEGFSMTRNQIDTLTRTYVHTANTEAMKAVYRANSDIVKKIRWMAAKGPKTCLICASLDGLEFPLEEHPPCPQHPRCRCVLTPKTAFSDLNITSPLAHDFSRDEGLTERMVPDLSESVGQWMRLQSPRDQQRIFGPRRYELLKAGVVTFSDLVDMTDVNNPRIKNLDELTGGVGTKAAIKEAKPHRQPTQKELQSQLDFATWNFLEPLAMGRLSQAEQRRQIERINEIERKMGRRPSTIRDYERLSGGRA